MRILMAFLSAVLLASGSFGTTTEIVGSYNNWASEWTAISSLNDADDALTEERLDFVGDSSNAGASWADNGTHLFFRLRVNDAAAVFSDTLLILIDVENYLYGAGFENDDPHTPDFSLAWDSNQIQSNHGFEMLVRDATGSLWSDIQMTDLDGSNGQKETNDINGDVSGRGYDGYIRTLSNQGTVNFGDTTYIDFAVSWNYLEAYTALARGQTWNVALGSIASATDHNRIDADVAGGANPQSLVTLGWSDPIVVPEPATITMLSLVGVLGLFIRRRFLA